MPGRASPWHAVRLDVPVLRSRQRTDAAVLPVQGMAQDGGHLLMNTDELKRALDEFMAFQMTGTQEAMSALHRLCQEADKVCKQGSTDWRERQPK